MIDQFCSMAPSIYGYADNTVRNYRSCLNQYDIWYNKKLELSQPVDIMNYLSHLRIQGRSGGTLTVTTSALRAFFDFLLAQQIVTANPTAGIRQRGRKKVRIPVSLDKGELAALLAAPQTHIDPLIRDRDTMFLALLASTGMRITETLNLRPADVDFPNKQMVVIGKGNKQATVFMTNLISPTFSKELERYVKKNKIHPNHRIFDIPTRSAQRLVTRWARKAGITKRVTPHTLRHTFGSLMATEKSLDLLTLKELMRHDSIETTKSYIHTTPADLLKSLSKAGAI